MGAQANSLLCHSNVQVTLQILAALIEKAPKDLPLFAPYVLRILDNVLRSNDITMVESSLPTFETFCEHHDASTLFADQSYTRQYENVLHQYAGLASTRHTPGKVQSKPVALRWRNSGLEAIKSVVSSDALSAVNAPQYEIVVPMILENLWTDNEDFLEVLLQRAQTEEKVADNAVLRRRTSIATVRTVDTAEQANANTNPLALSGSAIDVDKLAEEDIGVLAMQCLKQIFVAPYRAQILAATGALLKFVEDRVSQEETVVKHDQKSGKDSGWAIKMFSLVSRWAPVQDRYIILVTAMEALRKLSITDQTLQQHIVFVALVQSLLRSDVNLIGLSVMDILQQLILNIQRLVQLPGDPSGVEASGSGEKSPMSPTSTQAAAAIASQRKELLARLQQCLGDLATHVYYADQISDMISAIMAKLMPARSSSTGNSSPRGDKTDAVASSTGSEGHSLDPMFKLSIAKVAVLKAVKAILLVANPQRKMQDNTSLSRNRVPIQVWENTQWLLRDPDGQVRKAYADALVTWLDRETTKADQRAKDETAGPPPRANFKPGNSQVSAITIARRAASSASHREKAVKLPRSHFLQLLHVAIYDNALQYIEYETDMVLLHVLLAKLVIKLGVNAVRYGLPMIFRLQEDIQDAETPLAKVRIGSLCHGYFWILTEKFDCEQSVVGRAIHNEIVRRRSKHFWIEGIHMPPPMLELVGTPGMARPHPRMPMNEIESEALLPFDDRSTLVECIVVNYKESPVSPPVSPSASPGRSFTHPILGGSSSLSTIPAIETEQELPTQFKEQMLTEWTREAAMIAIQSASKSASLSGSRTGTTATNQRGRLTVNGNHHGQPQLGPPSPYDSQTNLRPFSQPGAIAPGPGSKLRNSSVRSGVSPAISNASSRQNHNHHQASPVTTVDQLKLALSGQLQAPPTSHNISHAANGLTVDDDSGDSMVSYDVAPSELSYLPSHGDGAVGRTSSQNQRPPSSQAAGGRARSISREGRPPSFGESMGGPLSSHPTHDSPPGSQQDEKAMLQQHQQQQTQEDDVVPPVPPLPGTVATADHAPIAATRGPPPSANLRSSRRSAKSRDGGLDSNRQSVVSVGTGFGTGPGPASGVLSEKAAAAMDLKAMLKGIDSGPGEGNLGNVTRPPY
jgi:protein EFR3